MSDPTSTICTDGQKTITIPTAQTSLIQPTTRISSLSSSKPDNFGRRIDRNPPSSSVGKVDTTRAIMTPSIHRSNSREVTPAVEQQKRQQQLEEVNLPLKKRRVDDEPTDRRGFMPPTTTATLQAPPMPPSHPPPQEHLTTTTSAYLSINNNTKYTPRPSTSSMSSTKDNNHFVGRSAGVPRSSTSDKPQSSAVRPVSVLHLVRERRKIRQQSPRPLCVGSNPNFPLPSNGIVEIAGPGGAGKSQLAISLCADCVSSNSKAKAVYVFLGGSGRSHQHTMAQRLNVMLRARWDVLMRRQEEGRRQQRDRELQQLMMSPSSNPDTPVSAAAGNNENNITDELDEDEVIRDCLDRVSLRWIRNSDELMELLESGLPQFLRQHPTTKVVVLDGIANLFRINEDLAFVSSSIPMNPWHNRAVTFFKISRMCRKTSSDFHVPFVVTNEATSKIRPVQKKSNASSFRINNSFDDDTSDLEPALGLAWFQCVDSRFFVKRGQRRSVPNPIFRKVQTRNGNRGNNDDDNNNNNNQYNGEVQATTSTNNGEVLIRTVRCIKAPNISTSAFGAFEFWIDQRGAVPLRTIV